MVKKCGIDETVGPAMVNDIDVSPDSTSPRWVRRLVRLAVLLVWPLIWVGGLVTTYDAGMAVPDWPGTYGYNLFLYPYATWLFGPFDLFIEHGHRLLGAVVGLVAIGIVTAAVWRERRRWVVVLTGLLLVMVICQGALGGARVLLGDRTLAMVHGCVGPAFFAFCVAMAVVTGRFWNRPIDVDDRVPSRGLFFLAMGWIALSYTQLVLGAMMRHVQPTASPSTFTLTVAMHVMIALAFWALVAIGVWRVAKTGDASLKRPVMALVALVGIQIALGIATWVVNYGYPQVLAFLPGSASFVVEAKGYVDSIIVTSHVATGSLILAVSTMSAIRIARTECGA